MLAESGTFLGRPPDAEVDVVALGEDPRVPARHGGEVDQEASAEALAVDPLVGEVALERDTHRLVPAELERSRRHAVDPIRADDGPGGDAVTVRL